MRPVLQSITDHDPKAGRFGDCLAASIASILEVPLADVPNFNDGITDQTVAGGAVQHLRVNEFLKFRGLALLCVPVTPDLMDSWAKYLDETGSHVWHLLYGISPRGHPHAVVALNGVAWHDPHPAGGMVDAENGQFAFGFLVRALPPDSGPQS